MRIKIRNYELTVMSLQEYAKDYKCDAHALFDDYERKLKYVAWLVKYDEECELIVGTSMENMLIYKDLTFGYTARGRVQKGSLREALECIRWIEAI